MAIRTNTNPRQMDLQPEMRDILMRNGMQAHIIPNGNGYQLAVQGHDSPLLTYNLTEKQMLALTDWGTNTANKKAYNVFTSIVANDFHMPRNFVHARNANGRVAMGLHGYRIGIGEYGRTPYIPHWSMRPHHHPMGWSFLGWTPRQQDGFHLRRVGGQMFYQGAPMVAERSDRRMKPGELQSGGYGFYYKGRQEQIPDPKQDVLQNLQAVITPMISRPRNEEPAKPYKELITSPVYFSNEKWQDCLASHGIVLDAQAKTLTIQSDNVNVDMVYDLRDDEIEALASNSIKDYSIEKRLDVLNNIIKEDYADRITLDHLNTNERIQISLHHEIQQELQLQMSVGENAALASEVQERYVPQQLDQEHVVAQELQIKGATTIDGKNLFFENENKGWYREGAHGREVQVDEISVHPAETEGKYRMTAVINGEVISHEINQKQYDKFLAVDDYHRMKLFSKVFDEVDMKNHPGVNAGLGMKIIAALTAGAVVTSEVARGFRGHSGPEFYCEHFEGPRAPRPYFKPGVDTPREVAARNFEAQANQIATDIRMGR